MLENPLDGFNKYFEIIPALTDDLKKEVYKLRYQVYCVETGFEKAEHYPNGIESDEYDAHSVHYLIQHRKSGNYAATTRLILPDISDIDKLFPIEKFTQIDNYALLDNIHRIELAEASRFCVSKTFKRRKHDAPNTLTGISPAWKNNLPTVEERRVYPILSIALFACLIKMSYENNIHYWYAVMEPALIRFFNTLGINFIGIGSITEYHGSRRPCIIKVSDLLNGVAEKNLAIWELMTNKGEFGQN